MPCDLTVVVIYQRKEKKANNNLFIFKHTSRIPTSLQPHWVTWRLELKDLKKNDRLPSQAGNNESHDIITLVLTGVAILRRGVAALSFVGSSMPVFETQQFDA